MKTPIKFKKRYKIYNVHEIAGFIEPELSYILKHGYGALLGKEPEKKSEKEQEQQEIFSILRHGYRKIQGIIESVDESGYTISDDELQQLIDYETNNRNRDNVKKVIQDEIDKRSSGQNEEQAADGQNGEEAEEI